MHTDRFWRFFWVSVGSIFLVLVAFCATYFYLWHIEDPDKKAAVGASYDPERDPFRLALMDSGPNLISDSFYRESLPFGSDDWSWAAEPDWRSDEDAYEGIYSLKANILEPWGGVRINREPIDISSYSSFSFAIKPTLETNELYVELHDEFGNGMGRQMIGWYATTSTSTLSHDIWDQIEIPLVNLLPLDGRKARVSGFSVSSSKPGIFYLDSVKLGKTEVVRERWQESSLDAANASTLSDPFSDASDMPLPSFPSRLSLHLERYYDLWRPIFGLFDRVDKKIRVGPSPRKTNGSMVVFNGGKEWKDYRVDTEIHQGVVSTFSILVRFIDGKNFVSCAFSIDGSLTIVYQMKDGESFTIAKQELPPLNRHRPWYDIKYGAKVAGDELTCSMQGRDPLTVVIPTMPEHGTVGIETWSAESRDYPHTINFFEVQAAKEL